VILIVSHPGDDHAVAVLGELSRRRHPVTLVDTARFPSDATLTQRFASDGPGYRLQLDGREVDLSACRVGWWRRPQPFTLHEGIASDAASFAYTECHEAVAGLWAALDLTWVNPPELDEVAHHKPYQLAAAIEVGLPVPRTLITNDPEEAGRFARELGLERTVYKTFLATEEHWRETRVLRAEEVVMLDRVALAPVIFQEFVPAVCDIRVTAIGDRLFATAISAPADGYEIDYRMELGAAIYEATELPHETEELLHALMRRLGLVFGAIDLRRTPEGEHIFLEVNPAGEWRFVEERSGQPLTEAMADLLIGLDREGRDGE
jgi:glutathione synthase/RimK-type ligase-like ATP-grasp enzyme